MQHSKSSKSDSETLFGAKISGGGSGGTVCVIGKNIPISRKQIRKVTFMFPFVIGNIYVLFYVLTSCVAFPFT